MHSDLGVTAVEARKGRDTRVESDTFWGAWRPADFDFRIDAYWRRSIAELPRHGH